jgi:N-acetylglucosamine-6-sulfatase
LLNGAAVDTRLPSRDHEVGLPKLLLLCSVVALVAAGRAAAQPNVLLIVTDDQRWDTLGYMPTVQSELAGKGVTFTNAFVVNPVCCPARTSLLTGRWSHSTGVWGVNGPHGGFHVFDDASTLPVWLDRAGYKTMLAGKYLNGYLDETYRPPGWDRWFAFTRNPNRYFDYGVADDGRPVVFGSNAGDYATDVLADRAERFIREAGNAPFFLYFAPKAPHIGGPGEYVTPAPRHAGSFAGLDPWRPPNVNEPDVSDKPAYIRNRAPVSEAELDQLRQEQLESLLAVDEAVARMLDALRETGELTDTLVVFTSDHGFGWGEHRRTHKVVPYEESIRVPLVIRYDRLGLAAHAERRVVLNVDLAPTVAAATGKTAPGAEGRNLLPLMAAQTRGWRPSFLYEAYMGEWNVNGWGAPGYCAFRGVRWKYVQYNTGEEEVYDLARDPYELRSLHRTVSRAWLMAYRERVRGSACRPPSFAPLPLCTRVGTAGPDRLFGTVRRDWICAGGGPDRVDVRGGGADVARCGPGFDRARAGPADRLVSCERRGWG